MFLHRKKKNKRPRIIEIDFIRGILICFMMVDHIFFDFWGLFPDIFEYNAHISAMQEMGFWYWGWPLRIGTRFAILAIFFLISGICTYFSRNTLKRGLIIFGVGVLISLGFFAFGRSPLGDGEYIFFGVITCFGVSMIIYWLLRALFKKLCPKHSDDFKWIALSLGVLIIAIGLMFDCWNIEHNGAPWLNEPLSIKNFFLVIVGRYQDAGAMDWLPLFPYMGFLFVGSFLGEVFYKEKKSYFPALPKRPEPVDSTLNKVAYYGGVMPYKGIKNAVAFAGHYSLYFYILHQVVIVLVGALILMGLGCKLAL